MLIYFKNRKLEKNFTEEDKLVRTYGTLRAEKIRERMTVLDVADSLKDFSPPNSKPERCHELTKGQRKGQLSMDLDHPFRLIFIPDHDPTPKLPDGGLDWSRVTAIKILGVENTHGK